MASNDILLTTLGVVFGSPLIKATSFFSNMVSILLTTATSKIKFDSLDYDFGRHLFLVDLLLFQVQFQGKVGP